MKILMVAPEAVPFSKTGGLGDVAGTLAFELKEAGADVRLIVPKYAGTQAGGLTHLCRFNVGLGWRSRSCGIETAQHKGVSYFFVENAGYFEREDYYGHTDDGERFSFFCRAVLESIRHTGFVPDVIHCNDWQTGIIPALLKAQYRHDPLYAGIKTVFTIHNIKYQGVFPWAGMNEMLGFGPEYHNMDALEYFGSFNFMKGGIVYSDALTTVSPTYADEIQSPEYGMGLDGTVRAHAGKLTGILNGIDTKTWNPAGDRLIASTFSSRSIERKEANKKALQAAIGLEPRDVPVIGMVGRLVEQKGLNLIRDVLDEIMQSDIQLAVLGSGDREYEMLLRWAADAGFHGRVGYHQGMSEPMAHAIYAGSDIFLMPSIFEPCGISQMIAMRYGAVPLVRETGGLKDTVKAYNETNDTGYAFSFAHPNAHDMLFTIRRALEIYGDKAVWRKLTGRCMRKDFSWRIPAGQYMALYGKVTGTAPCEPGK